MSTFNSLESACVRVRRSLDSYVSRELDGAGGREVRLHLEGCPACSGLAEERERVRALVRRAVRREVAPGSLRMRIQEATGKSGQC
jgi:anti-sigma factor (TIGR02949 family)